MLKVSNQEALLLLAAQQLSSPLSPHRRACSSSSTSLRSDSRTSDANIHDGHKQNGGRAPRAGSQYSVGCAPGAPSPTQLDPPVRCGHQCTATLPPSSAAASATRNPSTARPSSSDASHPPSSATVYSSPTPTTPMCAGCLMKCLAEELGRLDLPDSFALGPGAQVRSRGQVWRRRG